ncbi:MAG TPA: SGNH/GDSL hydrolase family protein [Polyangia bacterium]|nr:SGNH/GDSL hydrolase family protein [Polyangia bacterium]
MKSTRTILALFVSSILAGCGGTAAHVGGNGGTGGGGGGGDTGTGGNAGPLLPADAKIGTYIALGDSISDRGGTGPYFYDLLDADLTAKFPGLTYVHGAQQGAITDVFSDGQPANAPLLKSQIAALGNSYPGDVVVTITIGGNDLNAHALAAISNTDATLRAELDTHLQAELGELATAGRLGSGKVYIVLANIYDFTDGQGDFATVMCGPGVNISSTAVDTGFGNWNTILATNIGKVGGALYDMHTDFHGHGYNNTDATQIWYDAASCVHPNTKGHDTIRRSIYKILTGDTLQ